MAAKFIDYTGKVIQARRPKQGQTVGHDASPEDLAKALKEVTLRLAEIEAIANGPSVEFEVNLPASGQVYLAHNFNCPIRFYPVWWEDTSTTISTVNQSTDITLVTEDDAPAVAYKFNFDFTGLTLGAYTAAAFLTATAVGNTAGLVFLRSTARTVQTSPTTLDSRPGVNEPAIGNRTSTSSKTGLVIQSKVKQFVGASAANTDEPRNISRIEANGWTVGLNSTNVFPNTDSPNEAVTGCSKVSVLSSGYSPYMVVSSGAALTTGSIWTKNGSTQFEMNDGTPSANDKVSLGSGSVWQRLVINKGTLVATAMAACDCRDFSAAGGTTAQARSNVLLDYMQYEHGAFVNEAIATSGTACGQDKLSYATGSQLIAANGQVKMYTKFSPKMSTAMQVNYSTTTTPLYSAGWYLFSWGSVASTPANYAYIKDSDKKLYVKLAGGVEYVSIAPIYWSQYDVVEIYLAVGAGVPSIARYNLNGTGWFDMLMPVVADTPAPGSSAVYFFYNSVIDDTGNNDLGSLPCWLHQLSLYDTGTPSGITATTYTSGTIPVATTSTRPHSPDIAANRALSTLKTLVLNSYNAIKAIIRVEAAQQGPVSPPLLGV